MAAQQKSKSARVPAGLLTWIENNVKNANGEVMISFNKHYRLDGQQISDDEGNQQLGLS